MASTPTLRAARFALPDGAVRIGRVEDDHVVDAGAANGIGFIPTPDAWDAIRRADARSYAVADVRLLAPLRPGKIVCVGLNYRAHAAESGMDLPAAPLLFAKFPSCVIGPDDEIVVPQGEPEPDYEAELALIIGSPIGPETPRADLVAAVGGYTAFNDVSGRAAQFSDGQWTRGKSFDTFGPLGPTIVNSDEADLGAIDVRCELNGEIVQHSTTDDLIFDAASLLSHIAAAISLDAGDVVATGTPSGVGWARTPPRFLRDGDTIAVTVGQAGTLSNPVRTRR